MRLLLAIVIYTAVVLAILLYLILTLPIAMACAVYLALKCGKKRCSIFQLMIIDKLIGDKWKWGQLIERALFALGHERWNTNLKLWWKYGHCWMPRRCYIETFEYCPHRCDYCPNGHEEHRMPVTRMSDETFDLVLRRLQEMKYKRRTGIWTWMNWFCVDGWTGVVGFQRVSEPLLEKRLVEMVRKTRKALPKSYIRTNTAGQPLTRDLMLRLIDAGINKLVITQHDWVDQEWKDRISALCKEFGRYIDYRGAIGSAPWKINFGGKVKIPNGKPWKFCLTILDNIFICTDGTVPMCFADSDRKFAVGNIKEKPILDIILDPAYEKLRLGVVGGFFKRGKPTLDICKACFKGT
jgi:cyclic pyranopterin phosphate synthase